MRKVIGIGETILDIIFRDEQPSAAVPGGSVFNGIISLGRVGADVTFIGETGNDRLGNKILNFMRDNNVSTEYISILPDGKSPISLSFLDEKGDADPIFYKEYPKQRLDVIFPKINEDDIVLFGSYFSLNPVLRDKVLELLEQAKDKKAIVYYDPNFRSSHRDEAMRLSSVIIENLEYSDIVRGSIEDFRNMYKMDETDKIYKGKVQFYCKNFLCTNGSEPVSLRTANIAKEYQVKPVETVSALGAGDNFNAGIIYGLLKYDVRYRDLQNIDESTWDKIVNAGMEFSAEVCRSYNNSVSTGFAKQHSLS